jgi:3-methyladenine DNA glycosylase AlkD
MVQEILFELKALSIPAKIPMYTHFFRADPGDICYGDKFLAAKVPEIRKLVKKYYASLTFSDLKSFLANEYNEIRFFGLAVLSMQYFKTHNIDHKIVIVEFLKQNISAINHWNLVDDISKVFGDLCIETNDKKILEQFAIDKSIWVRRISIVACLQLLKRTGDIEFVLTIISVNIGQTHEYIHKAMGWILREVGKSNEKALIRFLQQNWLDLAPVTRSYATEKIRKTLNIKSLMEKN